MMTEWVKYIAILIPTLLVVWIVSKVVADTVSTHEVIEPEMGVKCVVVSRMFNTSVDCWKD